MITALIQELVKEFPFLIYKGRIFEAVDAPGGLITWTSSLGTVGFVESERVSTLESRLSQDSLNELARKKEYEHITESTSLKNEWNQKRMDALNLFLLSFLTGGKEWLAQELSRGYTKSEDEPDIITRFDHVPFHQDQQSMSVMESILPDQADGILFINGTYLLLTKEKKAEAFGTLRTNRNKTHNLQWGGQTQTFLEQYDQKIQAHMAARIEEEVTKHAAERNALRTKISSSVADIGEVNGRGYSRIGNKLYVYIIKELFYIIANNLNPARKYAFPTCKIGLEINYANGLFTFTTPTVILASKSIRNGKEYGDFQDLRGKDYPHPAVNGSCQPDEYPTLCITGGKYSYPNQNYSSIEKFRTTVNGILQIAHHNIEHGYWIFRNGKRETATVYHHFDNKQFLTTIANQQVI